MHANHREHQALLRDMHYERAPMAAEWLEAAQQA